MIFYPEDDLNWQFHYRISNSRGYITILCHLRDYNISSLKHQIIIPYRVISCWSFKHSYQNSCLLKIQWIGRGIEVNLCCRSDSDGIKTEIELIEIHGYYLLFCIASFKFDCSLPFFKLWNTQPDLSHERWISCCVSRIKLFCKLLCDCTSAPCTLSHDDSVNKSTAKTTDINTGMPGIANILCCYKCISQIGR